MTDTQRRVLHAIETGHALEVGDGVFEEKRTIHGIHGVSDAIAVSFEWSNEMGYIWEADFSEQSLSEAKIDGNRICMIDSGGEEVVLTIFQLEPAHI